MRKYGSTKYGASRAPDRQSGVLPSPHTPRPTRATRAERSSGHRPVPPAVLGPRRAAARRCRARGPTRRPSATPPRRVSRLHAERVRGWTGEHSLLVHCCTNPHEEPTRYAQRGGVRIVIKWLMRANAAVTNVTQLAHRDEKMRFETCGD